MMQVITVIRSLIKIIPVVIKHCPATSQFVMKFTLRLISNYSWVDNNESGASKGRRCMGAENLCQPVFVHICAARKKKKKNHFFLNCSLFITSLRG